MIKIVDKTDSIVFFGDLEYGDVFEDSGVLYIKTDTAASLINHNIPLNAVCLTTGKHYEFNSEREVRFYKAELHIL